MKQEIVTFVLAIWGAVLSSFAVGWQFYRDISQRGKLRVSCYIGNIVGSPDGPDPNDYLVYNITNIGKEPIMLTHIGGKMKDRDFMITPQHPLPRMLQPGEYILEHTSHLSVITNDLRCLVAIDSIGRVWKAPRKQVRKILEDHSSK